MEKRADPGVELGWSPRQAVYRPPLNELLQKAGDGDFLRAVAESVLQLLMEADVEGLIGAGRHEPRASDRLNWRNGYRDRTLDTRLRLAQPQDPEAAWPAATSRRSWRRARRRKRRWSPSSRRPGSAGCRRAWVDEIAQAMGLSGISKKPGLETVQGNRRAREGLPRPSARGRLALSVAGCDLPEGARGRDAHRFGRRDNRCGRQHRRTARDRRARRIGPSEAEDLLGGLPEAPDQTRPARYVEACDLGRARRRAEGRRPAGRRARHGNAVACTFHARNALAYLPKTQETASSPPPSARPSSSRTARRRARSGGTSPINCGPSSRNSAG